MGNELIISGTGALVPVQIAEAGEEAAKRFVEFFTAEFLGKPPPYSGIMPPPCNGMMPPPDSEMIAPPITE